MHSGRCLYSFKIREGGACIESIRSKTGDVSFERIRIIQDDGYIDLGARRGASI